MAKTAKVMGARTAKTTERRFEMLRKAMSSAVGRKVSPMQVIAALLDCTGVELLPPSMLRGLLAWSIGNGIPGGNPVDFNTESLPVRARAVFDALGVAEILAGAAHNTALNHEERVQVITGTAAYLRRLADLLDSDLEVHS